MHSKQKPISKTLTRNVLISQNISLQHAFAVTLCQVPHENLITEGYRI